MRIIFEPGDIVKVTRGGSNASTVARSVERPINGVYSISDWMNCEFLVANTYIPIKFDFSPEVYGAYPLFYQGDLIGYVYNDALEYIRHKG
jgi:hypothetical protein